MFQSDHKFLSKLNSTNKDWQDFSDVVIQDMIEIKNNLKHGTRLRKEYLFGKIIEPGYRALFYGSHQSEKILAATLLGRDCGLDVYKIDLSAVVSKNIEETKKKISAIFDSTKHKDWILFFDEADSLFSDRASLESSNYMHPNEQADYFLEKIKSRENLIILASTSIKGIEESFTRNINIMIPFLNDDVK